MATVNGKHEYPVKGVAKSTWASLTTTDADGSPLDAPNYPQKTVAVVGTFGAGGELTVEGLLPDNTWVTLKDNLPAGGSPLVFSTAGMMPIAENPLKIRPRVTGGDGTTSLTVTIISESARR